MKKVLSYALTACLIAAMFTYFRGTSSEASTNTVILLSISGILAIGLTAAAVVTRIRQRQQENSN